MVQWKMAECFLTEPWLVGGFSLSEKSYSSQIGSSPQNSDEKKHIWNHHPDDYGKKGRV